MARESERPGLEPQITGWRAHLAGLDTEQVVLGILILTIVAIGVAVLRVR